MRNTVLGTTGQWHRTAVAWQQMWIAASEVIWRRSFRMMTGTMTATEANRMVVEKPVAFALAAQQAALAAMAGQSGARQAGRAIAPVRQKARANARRLRR